MIRCDSEADGIVRMKEGLIPSVVPRGMTVSRGKILRDFSSVMTPCALEGPFRASLLSDSRQEVAGEHNAE